MARIRHLAALSDLCKDLNAATGIDPSTRAPARAGALAQDSAPRVHWKVPRACPWGSTAIPSISHSMAGRFNEVVDSFVRFKSNRKWRVPVK